MSSDQHLHAELSRDLNLFHITMMGLGMMIGAGVFIGIGNCIEKVGPGGLVLTFALNGLIALFTCMSFAELSSAIPRAGGVYNFARMGFGKGTSFLAGWMEWFASSVAGSLYAVTFATYTLEFFVQVGWLEITPGQQLLAVKLIALLVSLLFIYINYRGSSETGKIGAFFTLGQMAFVWTIAVLGVIAVLKEPGRVANFEPFMPEGWGRLLVTMGFIYVAFEGFEVIAQAGDETIDPKKNIPRAMLLSVLIVTLTYVVVSFATVVSVRPGAEFLGGRAPWQWIGQFKDTGFGRAVGMLMPSRTLGALVCFLAVLFSSTSALNATIYSATRASYALGRDNMLPPFFARISARRKTPWVALFFSGAIVIAVATLLPTKQVASCASIMFLFLFFLVNLCVIRIRYNMGDELQYGFLMPFFPVLPILAIVCQGVLVVFMHEMGSTALIIAPVWVGLGVVFYLAYGKRKSLPADHDIHVLDEEFDKQGRKPAAYRVMVSVANPASALSLIRNTYRICRAHEDSSLDILHMVPVPDQVPLSQAHEFMNSGREAIMETMMYFAVDITTHSTLRYCRHIPRGIIEAVREKVIRLLILGWHGRHHRQG